MISQPLYLDFSIESSYLFNVLLQLLTVSFTYIFFPVFLFFLAYFVAHYFSNRLRVWCISDSHLRRNLYFKTTISKPFQFLKCPSCCSDHIFINDDGFEDCRLCSCSSFSFFRPAIFEPTTDFVTTIFRSNLIPAVSTPLIAGATSKGSTNL